MHNRPVIHCFFLIFTFGASASATADVTVEQKFNIDAAGALSMAAMHGTTVTAIAADKSRTDNDLEFKSGLMRTFAGGIGKTTDIVRLDEDRMMTLDHKKKTYTEMTFAEMRERTEKAMQDLEEMQSSQGAEQPDATNLPVSEQNCEWSEPTVQANRTGLQQKIAGLNAEQTVITATQTCVDPETDKACDLTWTLEQWLAPSAPGGSEALAFWKNYAQRLGVDDLAGRASGPAMTQLFSQYEAGWAEIEKQSGGMEGYPVKTVMELEIGGSECTTPDGQPISGGNVFGDASAEMGGAAAEGVGEAMGGAIGGALAKGLFGGLGKKKKAKEEAAAAEAAAEANSAVGSVRLFRFETETTKIGTKSVPAKRFEVPAGFKLKD